MKHIEYHNGMKYEGDVSADFLSFYIWLGAYTMFYIWGNFAEEWSWKNGKEFKKHILNYLDKCECDYDSIFSPINTDEKLKIVFQKIDLPVNPYEEDSPNGVSLCNLNMYLSRFAWKESNGKIYFRYFDNGFEFSVNTNIFENQNVNSYSKLLDCIAK
jgi:hypothetical protein